MKRLGITLALLIACAIAVPMAINRPARVDASSGTPATLKEDMRKLWTDHVVWTRNYIIAAAAGAPDADAAASRLMKNQEDIGAAVAGFYGKAAGDSLTTLLKEHITIAVDVIKAAKAGDKSGLATADARWQKIGDDIATFLSKANPNWPRATLVDLMKKHLATTTTEVTARLNKDWAADVRAYDAVYDHILMMSDALAAGIVTQFPEKFTK
jgi:hypothetical protein